MIKGRAELLDSGLTRFSYIHRKNRTDG